MKDLAALIVGLLAMALATGVIYTISGLFGLQLIEGVAILVLTAFFLAGGWGLGHAIIEWFSDR